MGPTLPARWGVLIGLTFAFVAAGTWLAIGSVITDKTALRLICLAMDSDRLDALELPAMVPHNTALGGTGFSISIDARVPGMTTGISSRDRAQTIRTAIDPNTRPQDLARPGHVFPLRSVPGGVLERRGHTEAAVDFASLAGLGRSGVICEILNEDGSMARVPDLIRFCSNHHLKMVAIADLVRYRCNQQSSATR